MEVTINGYKKTYKIIVKSPDLKDNDLLVSKNYFDEVVENVNTAINNLFENVNSKYEPLLSQLGIKINDTDFNSPISLLKSELKLYLFLKLMILYAVHEDYLSNNYVDEIFSYFRIFCLTKDKPVDPISYEEKHIAYKYLFDNNHLDGENQKNYFINAFKQIQDRIESEDSNSNYEYDIYDQFINSMQAKFDIYNYIYGNIAFSYKFLENYEKSRELPGTIHHTLTLLIDLCKYAKKDNYFEKSLHYLFNKLENIKISDDKTHISEFTNIYKENQKKFFSLFNFLTANSLDTDFLALKFYYDRIYPEKFISSLDNDIVKYCMNNIDLENLYLSCKKRKDKQDKELKKLNIDKNKQMIINTSVADIPASTSLYYLRFLGYLKLYNINLNDISFDNFYVSINNPNVNVNYISQDVQYNQHNLINIYIDYINSVLKEIESVFKYLYSSPFGEIYNAEVSPVFSAYFVDYLKPFIDMPTQDNIKFDKLSDKFHSYKHIMTYLFSQSPK